MKTSYNPHKMKDKTDCNKIRALLDRWYSGLSSPEEELILGEMLESAKDLPSDLEADRILFAELGALSESVTEMPEEYKSRIDLALEKEIACESKRVMPIGMRRIRWKRLAQIAAGVAACFACVLLTMKVIDAPELEVKGDMMATDVSDNIKPTPVEIDDTLQNRGLALNVSSIDVPRAVKPDENRGIAGKSKTERKIYSYSEKQQSEIVVGDESAANVESENDHDTRHVSMSDETFPSRENYRVVRDQSEADAIINSIFSRLESNVSMETSKLSKIELEYDSEVSRLSGIENVGLLKEYYHEKTPL